MPIIGPLGLRPINQEEFAELVYRVMRVAFECQSQVVQRLPLTRGNASLGRQCFHLLNPETAFRVTALTDGISNYERNLRAMLRLSPLRTLQWVNLGRQKIQLVSLIR